MKSFLPISIALLIFVSLLPAKSDLISVSEAGANRTVLLEKSDRGFTMETDIARVRLSEVATPWGRFTTVSLPDFEGEILEIGKARLPAIHQLIDVPYGASVQVRVLSGEYREISLAENSYLQPVLPYQGPIAKTEEALRNHRFRMDGSYYASNRYAAMPLVSFAEAGNLRGHRLGQIRINAVQYLPAQNKIRIYHHVKIQVTFTHPDLAKTAEIHRKYQSPYFDSLLREFTLNYESTENDLTQYPVNYLIIYYDAFESALTPFIHWKEQKGFRVKAVPISVVGNSTTAITSYIQNEYNGPNPPSFVLLVGDKEQITTNNGQAGSHVTDLYYVTITPGDFVPDIYIGRLSAQVLPQLTAQIDKILPYEQYQLPQTAFLNHGCFAATDDGGNYQTAEGTHNYVINTHFIPNNLQYDKLYAITYNATGQQVMAAVNDGRFILNYSGHGSTTSWGGPSVSQAMINTTTNTDRYPFVISNACLTGSFQVSECFGETWVRKANGGALAFTGASNSTYWDEDDEWERRAYDGVFWENYHTLAAFVFRGNLGVLNAGYNKAQYYFEVYHLFGDPSLMLYWGEPAAMTVSHTSVLFIGSPVYDVTVAGEDSALVSLYMNGVNYGTALTDANGQAQIQLDPVPTVPGNMILTVTKFNRQPVIDTLQVIPASGPYLYCLKPVVNDQNGNHNGIPEAGETLGMGFTISNVGIEAAQNVQLTLTTTDTLVEILTSQAAIGNVAAGDTITAGDLQLALSPDIPHLHSCQLDIAMQDDAGHSWQQSLYVTIRRGAKIEILDSPLAFPNTFLNFSSARTLSIQNNGPDTLWISDITSDIPQFTVNPTQLTIPPGSQNSIDVLFTPDDTLTYTATFTVENSDPINFQATFSASGSGIYAPDIAFAPDSISRVMFVTDSALIPVVIQNNGLGELTYSAQIAGYPSTGGKTVEASGGADNFGHIWIDSDEESGPDFQWVDITQTGTPVALTGNNAISNELNMGFNFPFYGQTYDHVRVCTNGWLSFTTFSVAYNNFALPSNLAPRTLIAPMWDDLNFTQASKAYILNESHKTIIAYHDVYRVTGEGPFTFEVILYDNGNIILQYLHLANPPADYTVGIQNEMADDGLTIAYNQPYLKDSLAIIISKHSWATVSPMSGNIAPLSSDTLFLQLKTENFPTGEFWASIQVESNDPDESLAYIPIHMKVDSSALGIEDMAGAIPTRFALEQNWPNPFNPSTTITYSIPKTADVELAVYDVLGQRVKTLVQESQNAGKYRVRWDGTNDLHQRVASGVYIYRLQADGQVSIRKMIFMR